jgi:hypothetical protein
MLPKAQKQEFPVPLFSIRQYALPQMIIYMAISACNLRNSSSSSSSSTC